MPEPMESLPGDVWQSFGDEAADRTPDEADVGLGGDGTGRMDW